MKNHSPAHKFCITDGSHFKLSNCDPADKVDALSEKKHKHIIKQNLKSLRDLQELLYADNTWALLLVFQGMDAAGKDGTIKHVMRGVNPQGCDVYSFKQPSREELSHDFLWRCTRRLPPSGRIGIFNRSHYEEVLVVRVHPQILENQRLPAACRLTSPKNEKRFWANRYESIVGFERHLARNGVKILKFFLHISPEEQRQRLLARLDEKGKNWKFEPTDLAERAHWDKYMAAYEDMIQHTSTPEAPWFVVPADDKTHARYVVGSAIIDALRSMKLSTPPVTPEQSAGLQKARKLLQKKK